MPSVDKWNEVIWLRPFSAQMMAEKNWAMHQPGIGMNDENFLDSIRTYNVPIWNQTTY